jgi:hypothetical protein
MEVSAMSIKLLFPDNEDRYEEIVDSARIAYVISHYPWSSDAACFEGLYGWICNREPGHDGPHVAYIAPSYPAAMWYTVTGGETFNEAMLFQAMWARIVEARQHGATVGDCLWTLKALIAAIGDGELA